MANAYGGALAYGITQIKGSIGAWRILFLIEGLPTCCFAIVCWFFIPDGIREAPFLNEREKEVAFHFVARNQRLDVGKEHGLRFKEVLEAFKDPKSFLPALCYFGWYVQALHRRLKVMMLTDTVATFHTPRFRSSYRPSYQRWAHSLLHNPRDSPRRPTLLASSSSTAFAGCPTGTK